MTLQMKIYSQIKNPADPLPQQEDSARQSHFTFHNSDANGYSDPRHSHISDASSHKHKNKFSFRLQPQLYFQRNHQNDKLYHAPSHIRLASSSSQKSLQELSRQLKGSHSRKKIFDQSMRVTVLNEAGQKTQKTESKLPQKTNQLQQPPKNDEQAVKPLVSILKKRMQGEKPNSMNNSSFQRSRENSRKNIHRVQFIHEDTDKYLTQPILQDLSQHPQKQQNPHPKYVGEYLGLAEKVQRNQRQLMELTQKLDRKIIEDNQRNSELMMILAQNAHKIHQKEVGIQSYERQMSRMANQKISQRQRINLQIQQSKRLQELILQNRHLCAKVLEQSARRPKSGPSQEELQIEERIKELQSMRQHLQQNHTLSQSQSLHLNNSTGQTLYLNTTIPPNTAIQQERGQANVGQSALTVKQGYQASNFPTFQMIPERDVPAQGKTAQVKRVVLVSKIY